MQELRIIVRANSRLKPIAGDPICASFRRHSRIVVIQLWICCNDDDNDVVVVAGSGTIALPGYLQINAEFLAIEISAANRYRTVSDFRI